MPNKQQDNTTLIAVAGAAALTGLGVYFWLKSKPPGFTAGGVVLAKLKFRYEGPAGNYVLQNSFGNILLGGWFDHVEGMTWEKTVYLKGTGAYEYTIECPLPIGADAKAWDAEVLIRTSTMARFAYFIKKVVTGAIRIQ